MSGFIDFKSADWSVWGMYGSAFLVVVGFGLVIKNTLVQPPTEFPARYLKCSAETCDYAATMTYEECEELAAENYEMMKVNDPDTANMLMEGLRSGPFGGRMMGPSAGGDPEAQTKMLETMIISQWGNPQSRGYPFACPSCQQETVYKAMNCTKCELIFFKGIAQDPRYADRCPDAKCAFSSGEARAKGRNKQAGARRSVKPAFELAGPETAASL